MTKRCPIRDELIDEHAKVCPYCDEKTGFEQESSKTSCPICGELISEDADICLYYLSFIPHISYIYKII